MSQLGCLSFRKKVTNAKEGPLELRREKGKGLAPREEEVTGKGAGMPPRE